MFLMFICSVNMLLFNSTFRKTNGIEFLKLFHSDLQFMIRFGFFKNLLNIFLFYYLCFYLMNVSYFPFNHIKQAKFENKKKF